MKKRVFITGGASGLGKALAQAYIAQGAQVAFGDINEAEGLAVEKLLGENSKFLKVNVTKDADAKKAADWITKNWGGLDVLINNAGVPIVGKIEDLSMKDWSECVDINVFGYVRMIKAMKSMMPKGSKIINIGSMSSVLYLPEMSSYSVSKASVLALSESLLYEFMEDGIDVHIAMPTFFRSNLGTSTRAKDPKLAAKNQRLVQRARLSADEVAKRILQGAEAGDFHIFVNKKTRRTWQMKRFLPYWLYKKSVLKEINKFEARMNKAIGDTDE